MNENIEIKLVKYLMNAANIDDLEVLSDWLKDDQNKQIFKNYIRTNYAIDINTNEFDTENAKKEYLRKIRQDKKLVHKLRIYKVFKYAAAAVIVFGLGYFFQQVGFKTPIETIPIIVNTSIEPGTDKATLTLGDGSHVALEKGASFQTQNANSNGAQIIYEETKQNTKEIVYNYLTIPRGGQFFIKLADGTKVWLNSESQLKYPVSFIDGETREVELVYGEAYFDVSSSTEHNGSKFKVFNQSQEVEVLGTEFNLKAYQDESNIYTTLVEGKVVVDNGILKQNLEPNQQSNLNTETNTITIAKVDVKGETSWKYGVLSFIDKPLKDIMKVISRWYDVDIIFENKELESVEFIGVINKQQSIEDILSIMKSSSINSYEVNNKTIILK
ncbi:MAG: FecR domain-containing protein [Algibacter sp.]